MEEVDRTMLHMKDDAANIPDTNDRATQESEFGLELRTRDRERKLLKKIDSAIARIDEGNYGYCEETGDEIGLRRLGDRSRLCRKVVVHLSRRSPRRSAARTQACRSGADKVSDMDRNAPARTTHETECLAW
jgi:RNA polymerase-binding protein DksA